MFEDMTPKRRAQAAVGALALLLAGGAAGAAAIEATRPSIEMAPMAPVAIARLPRTSGPVTLKGRVAETFGPMFVIEDGTGRALVDTGPRGGDGSPFAVGAVATVQGRYDRGIVHASFLVDGKGDVTALAPPPPPPHGHRGPPPPPGARDEAPPPPPAIANGTPPAAPGVVPDTRAPAASPAR